MMMNYSQEQPMTYPPISLRDLELLSAFLDDELTSREREQLETRMQKEPALRHHLEELKATVMVLHQLRPALPPRSFALRPELLAQPQPVRPQLRINWTAGRIWAGVMLASLLLLVSLTTLLITLDHSGKPPESIQQVASQPGSPVREHLDRGDASLLVTTDIPLVQTRPQELDEAVAPAAPAPSPPPPPQTTGNGASRGSIRDDYGVAAEEPAEEEAKEPEMAEQPYAAQQPGGESRDYPEGYAEESALHEQQEETQFPQAMTTPTPRPEANSQLSFLLTFFILILMAMMVGSVIWFVRHRR